MTVPLIEFRDVTKEFVVNKEAVTALKNVSATIQHQDFVSIYGASGSGKSTLLDTMIGLQTPTEGSVAVDGEEVYELSPADRGALRARKFGVVYQRSHWVGSMTVAENVALPLFFLGWNRKAAIKEAKDQLAEVGMERFANYQPELLSGGQQQRVSIARALIASPDILVADEPTGSLDKENGERVVQLLLDSWQRLGRTVIVVTHDLKYLDFSNNHLRIENGFLESTRNDNVKR